MKRCGNFGTIARILVSVLAGAWLTGCSQEALQGAGAADESVARTEEALATPDAFYSDASGQVRIVVRTCDYGASFTAGPHCTLCAVDQGWVMIGGGAEIALANSASSNARLRGSFPYPFAITDTTPDFGAGSETCTSNVPVNDTSADFIAWAARSNGTSSHKLRAYVIGLQVDGFTASELRSALLWSDETTSPSPNPSHRTSIWAPGTVISGGANMLGNAHGYLTESRPMGNADSWRGAGFSSDGLNTGVKVYYLTQFNVGITVKLRSASSASASGFTTAGVPTPYPWVTASIGGKGLTGSTYLTSRTLRSLLPFASSTQGATATSAEQGSALAGATTAYAVNIYRDSLFAPWRYNTIRSADFGTSLSRPSGTAPVRLRESTTVPDGTQAALRWHLEDRGSGRYRIRNANPSNPEQGECAYWSGSATNEVRVGACSTGNAYLWTYSAFQFQNVASGTCMNPTGTNSNMALAACQSNGSQLFVQGAAAWPP